MFKLKNWFLMNHGGECVTAHGHVFNNPKFYEGCLIHTSHIEKVVLEEDKEQLVLITHSQSHYVLSFAEINVEAIENTKACFDILNIPRGIIDKCVECTQKHKESVLREMSDKMQPRELYLNMSGNAALSAYFKKPDGEVVEAYIDYHAGMFVDSILIRFEGAVDFRYYPQGIFGDVITPYHWSDGLDRIIIKNVGKKLEFRGSDKVFDCESGEELIIESKDYRGEGLVSPDCVNGKSAFLKPDDFANFMNKPEDGQL